MKPLFIAIAAVLLLAACAPAGQTREASPLKIGLVLPLTGPASAIGTNIREGAEWKLDDLTNKDYPIEVFFEDSQSDPKQAVTAFNKVVDVKGAKIVFTIVSSISMTLKPLAEEKHVLLWANAAHPDLTRNSNLILRHSNTAESDALVLANAIANQGFKKVGILYQQDDWGQVFNTILNGLLEEKGIRVVSEAIDHRESDFRTPIAKVKGTDALALIAFGPAAGVLVKQAKELGYGGALYSSVGFVLTPDAQKIAGDAANGMYYVAYQRNEAFDTDYRARFSKEPAIMSSVSYTDLELLLYAVEQTKSTRPEDLVTFIKGLGEFQGTYEHAKITPAGDILIPTTIATWGENR